MSEQQERVDPSYVEALHKKITALEERVDELESQLDESQSPTTSDSVGVVDSRDQAVLDHLGEGDVVGVSGLQKVYRAHTDIRNKRTLKNRVQTLTNRPEFEWLAPGKWRYTGGDDDE